MGVQTDVWKEWNRGKGTNGNKKCWREVKCAGRALKRLQQLLDARAREIDRCSRDGDPRRFYKQLKCLDAEGTRPCSLQFIRDKTASIYYVTRRIFSRG